MTIWYLMGLELTMNWIYKLQTPSHEWSNLLRKSLIMHVISNVFGVCFCEWMVTQGVFLCSFGT